jgi:DNA-binding IclR family transcriptional regulator
MSVTSLSRNENRPAGGAQVLDRVVALLGALSASGELPPGELAERCDLPPSTTYRLIADLEGHGLVTRAGRRGATLGLWILELARSVEDRLEAEVVEPAREVMDGLAHRHGETAILTAPGGTHAMCLASVESDHHAMRLSYDRWRTAPMHLGASGKVLLAHLDDAHAERILADPPPHPAGDAQLPLATLRAQIEATRRDGYLVTDGELDPGATAVAAPVVDARGRPVAGLSLAGPTPRVRAMLHEIVPGVVAGAAEIARRMKAP